MIVSRRFNVARKRACWQGFLVIVAASFATSCGRADIRPQPGDSLIPSKVWRHIDEADKGCVERAYRKIKTLGKTYHFTDRGAAKESIKEIWIDEQLLRIPRQQIVRVNYGSGHLTETPGMNVLLYGWLPDMRVATKERPLPDEERIDIRIACWPTMTAKLIFERPARGQFTEALADIGLVGKSHDEKQTWTYWPSDEAVKNFNGHSLQVICHKRYSMGPTSWSNHDRCSSGFLLRDRVWVSYSFREIQLPHWRQINVQVIKLVTSFLQGEE